MAETNLGACTRETCDLKNNGKCELGHDPLSECPDYNHDQGTELTVEVQTNDSGPSDITNDVTHETTDDIAFRFSGGIHINSKEFSEISVEGQPQVVIIAGASECGKTTMISCIYELFLKGQVSGYSFSGSKTLQGFEQRNYLSRISSGRTNPDTGRTIPKEEIDFLHLKVSKDESSNEKQDILFTDISGERYKALSSTTQVLDKFSVLKRADHIAILIDGEALIDPDRMHVAYMDCRSLLRSCLDAEMVGFGTYVDIIFSKWDLVEPQGASTGDTGFIDHIEEELNKEFSERFKRLRFTKIAARPENQQYRYGYNLEHIFSSWVDDSADRIFVKPYSEIDDTALRQIDRFALRSKQEDENE